MSASYLASGPWSIGPAYRATVGTVTAAGSLVRDDAIVSGRAGVPTDDEFKGELTRRARAVPRDERDLVEAARTDAQAFAELYQRYVGRIYDFAYRRSGSRQVAEDVTSATFERALDKLDKFRWHAAGFAPWLFRLAANELANHHRGVTKHQTDRAQRVLGQFHQASTTDASPDPFAASQLDSAMQTLSERHQRALSLRYFADLDHEEAAAAMGMPKGSFAVTLHRAKAALRKAIERSGIDPKDLT